MDLAIKTQAIAVEHREFAQRFEKFTRNSSHNTVFINFIGFPSENRMCGGMLLLCSEKSEMLTLAFPPGKPRVRPAIDPSSLRA
jgi:hypothetical protein